MPSHGSTFLKISNEKKSLNILESIMKDAISLSPFHFLRMIKKMIKMFYSSTWKIQIMHFYLLYDIKLHKLHVHMH